MINSVVTALNTLILMCSHLPINLLFSHLLFDNSKIITHSLTLILIFCCLVHLAVLYSSMFLIFVFGCFTIIALLLFILSFLFLFSPAIQFFILFIFPFARTQREFSLIIAFEYLVCVELTSAGCSVLHSTFFIYRICELNILFVVHRLPS